MSQDFTECKRIGESEYEMSMLPPMQSHDLMMDVAKMVGPSVGPILDALFSKGAVDNVLSQELTPDFFTKAARSLFGDIDKRVLKSVIDLFKNYTQVDNKPLVAVFDVHFMGKIDELHKWILWGMQVQWGKSLSALVSEATNRAAVLKAQSQSTSPST